MCAQSEDMASRPAPVALALLVLFCAAGAVQARQLTGGALIVLDPPCEQPVTICRCLLLVRDPVP